MRSDHPLKISAPAVSEAEPAPEVWWGEDGIDALLWADAEPYAYPPTEHTAVSASERADGLA